MKRAIIGGFLSLTGSLWALATVLSASQYGVNGWSTPPGKLLTQLAESSLMPWFGLSAALTVLGLAIMTVEFFKKDP